MKVTIHYKPLDGGAEATYVMDSGKQEVKDAAEFARATQKHMVDQILMSVTRIEVER